MGACLPRLVDLEFTLAAIIKKKKPVMAEIDESQGLTAYGMTNQEIKLWRDLSAVAGQFLQLPTLHPSERNETVMDIHRLQDRLLSRPGLRTVGWPRPTE